MVGIAFLRASPVTRNREDARYVVKIQNKYEQYSTFLYTYVIAAREGLIRIGFGTEVIATLAIYSWPEMVCVETVSLQYF